MTDIINDDLEMDLNTYSHISRHKPEKMTLCDCASVQVILSYPKLGEMKRKCSVGYVTGTEYN